MTLQVFKFVLKPGVDVPHPEIPGLSYSGSIAVVIEKDEAAARRRLKTYAQENGLDPRWLDCVKYPIELNPNAPSTLCWVQF